MTRQQEGDEAAVKLEAAKNRVIRVWPGIVVRYEPHRHHKMVWRAYQVKDGFERSVGLGESEHECWYDITTADCFAEDESATPPATVQPEDETTLPALDVCKHCLVRNDLWPDAKCWHGEHEVEGGTLVPFSKSDACWCQPFDGPIHPQCPMHGNKDADLPPYDCTEAERVEWKSHWGRKLACRERQLISALRERDALTKIVKSGSFYPAYEAQKVRAEKAEAERDALKAERDDLADKNRQFDALCKKLEGLVDKACDHGEELQSQLDAVVGQETPQEAFRRGQDVMRKECARLFDDAIKWGHPDGSLKNTYIAPYTPPLKAGTE